MKHTDRYSQASKEIERQVGFQFLAILHSTGHETTNCTCRAIPEVNICHNYLTATIITVTNEGTKSA